MLSQTGDARLRLKWTTVVGCLGEDSQASAGRTSQRNPEITHDAPRRAVLRSVQVGRFKGEVPEIHEMKYISVR